MSKITNPNYLAEHEIKNEYSSLPTTVTSKNTSNNYKNNTNKVESSKNEKLEEIQKLEKKLIEKNDMIKKLNMEISLSKNEFNFIQKELYDSNELLSNKFSDIYNLELSLDKSKLIAKKMEIIIISNDIK